MAYRLLTRCLSYFLGALGLRERNVCGELGLLWLGIPSIEFALVNCAQSSTISFGRESHDWPGVRRR